MKEALRFGDYCTTTRISRANVELICAGDRFPGRDRSFTDSRQTASDSDPEVKPPPDKDHAGPMSGRLFLLTGRSADDNYRNQPITLTISAPFGCEKRLNSDRTHVSATTEVIQFDGLSASRRCVSADDGRMTGE
jgi:hypothetical protein